MPPKILHIDGNREGIIAVRVRSDVRQFHVTRVKCYGRVCQWFLSATTFLVAYSVLASDMLPGDTVRLFVTAVLADAGDAWTATLSTP
jgi:hypothetical protein